jgi:hypothetical protein
MSPLSDNTNPTPRCHARAYTPPTHTLSAISVASAFVSSLSIYACKHHPTHPQPVHTRVPYPANPELLVPFTAGDEILHAVRPLGPLLHPISYIRPNAAKTLCFAATRATKRFQGTNHDIQSPNFQPHVYAAGGRTSAPTAVRFVLLRPTSTSFCSRPTMRVVQQQSRNIHNHNRNHTIDLHARDFT